MKPSISVYIPLSIVVSSLVSASMFFIFQQEDRSLESKPGFMQSHQTKLPKSHQINNVPESVSSSIDLISDNVRNLENNINQLIQQQTQLRVSQNMLEDAFLKMNSRTGDDTLISSQQKVTEIKPNVVDEEPESQLSRILTLDAEMQNLESDIAWETSVQSDITNAFASTEFEGSSLQSVACKGITCRIEVVHNSTNTAEKYIDDSFSIISWDHNGKVEFVDDGSGGVTSIYYASRMENE